MPTKPIIGYRLTIEAVGLTKAGAVSQVLRLLASIVESPDRPGYCVGGTSGNGEAKFEEVNETNQ